MIVHPHGTPSRIRGYINSGILRRYQPPAPFPFSPTFQNGPRRPGSAPENLFTPIKDSPPPRPNRAPWTAAGRSETTL